MRDGGWVALGVAVALDVCDMLELALWDRVIVGDGVVLWLSVAVGEAVVVSDGLNVALGVPDADAVELGLGDPVRLGVGVLLRVWV